MARKILLILLNLLCKLEGYIARVTSGEWCRGRQETCARHYSPAGKVNIQWNVIYKKKNLSKANIYDRCYNNPM